MVVLGVDAHKRSHTVVAVDSNGKQLGTKTVAATTAGHVELMAWAKKFQDRLWAIEDVRSLSRLLEKELLVVGEKAVRVPPKLSALHRRSLRVYGKSDPIDARGAALAALREPGLPVVQLDERNRQLRLLTDHREVLVKQRTALQNRLHLHLHELDPDTDYRHKFDSQVSVNAIIVKVESLDETLVVVLALESLSDLVILHKRIRKLTKELDGLVKTTCPNLLAVPGCGPLSAAKLMGEIAGIDRFSSKDAFAAFNGTAPIPVWSGNRTNFRCNPFGNRQVNGVIHRIMVTQARCHSEAINYVERKTKDGMPIKSAKRALKRKISNRVFVAMRQDLALAKRLETKPESLAS